MVTPPVLAPAATGHGHRRRARWPRSSASSPHRLSPLRLHPGAALAVYRHGRLVLDLDGRVRRHPARRAGAAGHALPPLLRRPSRSPRSPSGSRSSAATAGLDDPVAAHWPAFGQHGKERVTLRHVLSHRGGFPLTPPELTPERWGDWEAAIRAIAAMPLSYEPGTVSAYHQLTQQWVCAELVRRLDGRAYADYLRAEITGPLGMADTYVGLAGRSGAPRRQAPRDGRDGRAGARDPPRASTGWPLHRMVVPAASGVSTARDMARFYAAFAAGGALDGARILRPETVARMLAIEVDGEIDRTFDVPVRRGLGFELGGLADPRRHWPGATSTARTFWHGGFGSSVCWGDRDLELAMAFLTNGVRRDEAGAIARRDLSDAVRAVSR